MKINGIKVNLTQSPKTTISITYVVVAFVFSLVIPFPKWVFLVALMFDIIENYVRARK
jgi:flagellar biosynthesis component FlhA